MAVRWASKLSRLYTDQAEFRQFYGQLHSLGATVPGNMTVTKDGVPSNAYHASQACVRLTRTFLHLFDHARKYAQSMTDNGSCVSDSMSGSTFIDEFHALALQSNSSKAPSLASFKRSPRRRSLPPRNNKATPNPSITHGV